MDAWEQHSALNAALWCSAVRRITIIHIDNLWIVLQVCGMNKIMCTSFRLEIYRFRNTTTCRCAQHSACLSREDMQVLVYIASRALSHKVVNTFIRRFSVYYYNALLLSLKMLTFYVPSRDLKSPFAPILQVFWSFPQPVHFLR